MNRLASAIVVALVLSVIPSTSWSLDPGDKCESSKLNLVGKYASCRLKAEAVAVRKGGAPDFSKCDLKFTSKYTAAETLAGSGICPTQGDSANISLLVAGNTEDLTTILHGGIVPICGNGIAEVNESCDGADLDAQSCTSLGYRSGTLYCTAGCGWGVDLCVKATCGNGLVNGDDSCDGANLNGQSCASLGFAGGTLACTAGCGWDVSACVGTNCGNDVVEGGESCDGDDLDGQSCVSLGYEGGTLDCTAGCGWDVGGCMGVTCGNDVVEDDESCDGTDLDGKSCVSLGYESGTLGCTTGCGLDVSGCVGVICGNGRIDGGESCDFGNLNGATCFSVGHIGGGELDCDAGCIFDTSECREGKFVFTTQNVTNGNLGGVFGANQFCQTEAVAAGLPGTYKAWISDDTTSPSNSFVQATVAYVLTNGVKIADDWTDLTDGDLDHAIDIDQFGNSVGSVRVWTGTTFNGNSGPDRCENWTNGGEFFPGGAGSSSLFTHSGWSYGGPGSASCAQLRPLYCFEQ